MGGRGLARAPPLLGLRGGRTFEAAAVPVACPEAQGGGVGVAQTAVRGTQGARVTPSLKSDLAWGQR